MTNKDFKVFLSMKHLDETAKSLREYFEKDFGIKSKPLTKEERKKLIEEIDDSIIIPKTQKEKIEYLNKLRNFEI